METPPNGHGASNIDFLRNNQCWNIGILVLEEFYLLKNDSFRFDSPLFHHSTIPLFPMNGMLKME